MYQKQFPKFVWEEQLQKLAMPHFYLGKDPLFFFHLIFLLQHLSFLELEVEFHSYCLFVNN